MDRPKVPEWWDALAQWLIIPKLILKELELIETRKELAELVGKSLPYVSLTAKDPRMVGLMKFWAPKICAEIYGPVAIPSSPVGTPRPVETAREDEDFSPEALYETGIRNLLKASQDGDAQASKILVQQNAEAQMHRMSGKPLDEIEDELEKALRNVKELRAMEMAA